jgi:hypothetical protein
VPKRFIAVVSCLAFGCAAPDLEGACKDFVAAANGCNQEHADAKGIEPNLLDESLCESDTSEATNSELEDAVGRYECKADAFGSADCATDDAYESAIDADSACDAS